MGKFQLGLIGMRVQSKPTKPVVVEGCCGSAVPLYLGKTWQIDNDLVFYPIPPQEDEVSMCHIMGPGNTHLYFCQTTNNQIEVDSPLEFLRGLYASADEAMRSTFTKLKINEPPISKLDFIDRKSK